MSQAQSLSTEAAPPEARAPEPDASRAAAPLSDSKSKSLFVRMLSGAVLDQALLSAANFLVGLVLIRHTSDLQYGYYILVTNAFLLLTSLQNAYIAPAVVTRFTRLPEGEHAQVIGSMFHEQRGVLLRVLGLGLLASLGLWSAGVFDSMTGPVLVAAMLTALAVMNREFFRIVMLAYRQPGQVLRSDVPYVVLLLAGAWIATQTALPATVAVASMGVAALCGGLWLSHSLQRHRPWKPIAGGGMLRQIAPLGLWSVAGAAIHWTFSQGYSYLVAGALDVTAVAAIAATRLLMMPVNLLSTGITSLMMPLTTGWVHKHGLSFAMRRLLLFALGLASAAMCYFAVMWLLRDWIFSEVLRKQFADRDSLLLMWCAIFLLMVMRDQIILLLVARERFRDMSSLSFVSALVSIAVSWWAMQHYGQIGALVGMLIAELVNLGGIVLLVLRERRRSSHPDSMSGISAGVAK